MLEALAEILDVPVNDVIYDAFKETSFNRTSNISHDDPIIELLLKLIEFCEAVVVNQSLSDYFQKGRNIGAEYNLVSGDFVRSKHPPFGSVEEGWDGGYEGAPETSWTRRAFPSAPLLRVNRARFKGPLFVERQLVASSESSAAEVARIVSPVLNSTFDNEAWLPLRDPDQVDAEVLLFTDICLAIGPRTRADDLGPLFELRPFVELKTNGTNRPLTFPYSLAPLRAKSEDGFITELVGSVAAQFEDAWRRVSGDGWTGWVGTEEDGTVIEIDENIGRDLDFGPQFEKRLIDEPGFPDFAVHWAPVNDSTLTQLVKLGRDLAQQAKWGRGGGERLFDLAGPHPKPTDPPLEKQTYRDFEIALATGAIEQALINDCKHLKTALAERIKQANETRERENAAMYERWRNLRQPE